MSKTILVVDDSPAVRSIIKVYLNWHKFQFLEAEEAERAWQVCSLMPVDLVIADVNMPGTNGIGFVRQLRSADRPNLKQLPVILLTGDKSEELQSEGMRAGANAFVHKPISNTALVALVEKLLQDESDPPRR